MYRKILVAIDGSPASGRALEHAGKLAQLSGARLRVLHIVDALAYSTGFERPHIYLQQVRKHMFETGETLLREALASLAAPGVEAETELYEGTGERVAEIVVRVAESWGADLVVLGTHGRRGFNRFMMGSDAELVARTCPAPVLLVRARPENQNG